MERILVPLDGSSLAERALAPALALAARHQSAIYLASIVSDLPPLPVVSPGMIARWLEGEELASGYLRKLKERLVPPRGVEVTTHVQVGPVAQSLLDLSEELDVDLLMLTTHGRGAWERIWLGSVADKFLRHSTKPFLILKAHEEGPEAFGDDAYPRHVLLPVDGSEGAEAVLEPLRALLPATGSWLTLASVLQQSLPFASTYLPHSVSDEAIIREQRVRMESYLEALAGRLREADVDRVDFNVTVDNNPDRSLLEFSEAEAVDLIALSTWGRGGRHQTRPW